MTARALCYKVKLNPGSLPKVQAWAAELNRRRVEVLATLRDETVLVEAAFLDRTPEGDFLIYFLKVRDPEQSRRAAEESTRAIDAYHREFKRAAFESRVELPNLIDFDLIDEDCA